MTELARTPLHGRHVALGARMVEFAGFSMPVQYTSILEEHAAVRERAAVFDVSHMGQIHLEGPEAIATAERLLTCPVASLRPGRVRYGLLCNERGGCVDDVTVYRTGEDALFLCVNAANVDKDRAWIESHAPEAAGVSDRSAETGLLALQGPAGAAVLGRIAKPRPDTRPVAELGRFRFGHYDLAGAPALVSRTGYTGSDGFEIYARADAIGAVFDALLAAGEPAGLVPAGLGARDTLRLEAALPLYGHELDDDTSPLEAGLERFVKRSAGGFVGAEAIEARERRGRTRQLVGFVVTGRGIARAGHALSVDGEEVGVVTSGAPSPTLGRPIGLGYVPPPAAAPGQRLDVLVRGRSVTAEVVETPFVSKAG
jgi:aminomethyltransferase